MSSGGGSADVGDDASAESSSSRATPAIPGASACARSGWSGPCVARKTIQAAASAGPHSETSDVAKPACGCPERINAARSPPASRPAGTSHVGAGRPVNAIAPARSRTGYIAPAAVPGM